MKKCFKKFISLTVCLAVILSSVSVGDLLGFDLSEFSPKASADSYNSSGIYFGDIIEFGSYPQSEVTDSDLIRTLNAENIEWCSFGYLTDDGKTDSFLYADVMLDNGEKYRAVKFSSHRSFFADGSDDFPSSMFELILNDDYVKKDTVYWFKYEPIKWKVLDSESGLIVCDTLIDAQPFVKEIEENVDITYADSSIRKWLNDDFYYTAFSETERFKILHTEVKNNIRDKVFLLSMEEADKYQMTEQTANETDIPDYMRVSDYASCNGICTTSKSKWPFCWLRDSCGDFYAFYCDDGRVSILNNNPIISFYFGKGTNTITGVLPACRVNLLEEDFNVVYRSFDVNKEIRINVKAIQPGTNKNTHVSVDNKAVVKIYMGTDVVASVNTESDGVARFCRGDFDTSVYSMSSILDNATVSAHYRFDNGLELCSETVLPDGTWAGTRLSNLLKSPTYYLLVDEPRWYVPKLRVMINESDYSLCKSILKKYSYYFAQTTNGHVIVNDFELVTVPDSFSDATFNALHGVCMINNIEICMVRNVNYTTPMASLGVRYDVRGLSNTFPAYGSFGSFIWCPVNIGSCAAALCHESGHFLCGFMDEYTSAMGVHDFYYNNKEIKNPNNYKVAYAFDADFDGLIEENEKNYSKWVSSGGSIKRPENAPPNFGIMEVHYKDLDALEMSTASDYSKIEMNNALDYTAHYYLLNASCEEKLEYELSNKTDGKYDVEYTKYEDRKQTEFYWFAGGENVSFSDGSYSLVWEESAFTTNDVVNDNYSGADSNVSFCYSGTTLELSSKSETELLITDINNNIVFDAVLDESNGYSCSFNPEAGASYLMTLSENVDGEYFVSELGFDCVKINDSEEFLNISDNVVLSSDNSENAVILTGHSKIVNGDYVSVSKEKIICTDNNAEVNGHLDLSISNDLSIDFSSLTWFLKENNEWVAIDTQIYIDEYGNTSASCIYAGDGTYCLMAKKACNTQYKVISDLRVSNNESSYDNEVTVSFSESEEEVQYYTVYYGKETITDENCNEMDSVVVYPGATESSILLDESGITYYFAVQVVGKDGGRSLISDNVTCSGAIIDSDSDGIPDYWLNQYSALIGVEGVSEADSDNDNLTNLQEYELGTNPLNPDTDGDNVYDRIELSYSLDPLNAKSDGTTDDYVVVYGNPDVKIESLSYDESGENVICKIANVSAVSAMRTSIRLYVDDELVDEAVVNLAEESYVEYTFSEDYLSEGMRVVLDEERIIRDSDYDNNEFVYIPATGITVITPSVSVLPYETVVPEYRFTPENANDFLLWKSDDETVATVSGDGIVKGVRLGKTTITATTSQGVTAVFEVEVPEFPNVGDFYYQVSDETVSISGYKGTDTDVIVPSMIEGYPVVDIMQTFYGNSTVTSVIIPDTVQTLVSNSFWNCSSLKSVKLPENLTVINQSAFKGCISLESIDFPNSLVTIENEAFYGCSSLESVTINKGIQKIGNKCFSNCSGLKKIRFNAVNCSTVVSYGFIMYGPFYGCNNVETILISGEVTKIPQCLFADLSKVTNVDIPSSVNNISANAFKNCKNLSEVNFLGKTTTIVSGAFAGCSNVCLYCFEDSTAHTFAVKSSLNYVLIDIVELSQTSAKIEIGKTLQLSAATHYDLFGIEWSSDNSSVAEVDGNGNIQALRRGYATITATNFFGKTASCQIQVIPNGSAIFIYSSGSLEQKVDWWKSYSSATINLSFTTYGCENAEYVVWSSSNSRVKIDERGVVSNTGYFARSSTITATAYDAEGKVVAQNSVKVSFYKFKWQKDRLQSQSVVSDNYLNKNKSEEFLNTIKEFEFVALFSCFFEFIEKVFSMQLFL